MATFNQNGNFEDPIPLCPPCSSDVVMPPLMAYFYDFAAPNTLTYAKFELFSWLTSAEESLLYGPDFEDFRDGYAEAPSDGGYPAPKERLSAINLWNPGGGGTYIPIFVALRQGELYGETLQDIPFGESGLGCIVNSSHPIQYSVRQAGPGIILLNITNSPAVPVAVTLQPTYQGTPIVNVFSLTIDIEDAQEVH